MFRFFVVSFLFFMTFPAFSHPPGLHPYPQVPLPEYSPLVPYSLPPDPFYHPVVPYVAPPLPVCPAYQGSHCYTWTGNVCPMLAPYHQPEWFDACVDIEDSFHLCIASPHLVPSVQGLAPICAPTGSDCFCSFGLWNGYPAYEPGFVGL